MNNEYLQWRTASGLFSKTSMPLQVFSNATQSSLAQGGQSNPSYSEVVDLIDKSLSSLKVYVVESEITQTQNAVKTIVQQASF